MRSFARTRPRPTLRYLLRGKQLSNFYYENENEDDAAATVAAVTGDEPEAVSRLFAELRSDRELYEHLHRALAGRPFRDPEPHFGYRLLVYAAIRLARPREVLEIGTHDGIGSTVMLRALERNAAEGDVGRLTTCDQNPDAGWLIPASETIEVKPLIGDVMQTVPEALDRLQIDFMVEDIGASFDGKGEIIGHAADARVPLIFIELGRQASLKQACARAGGAYAEFEERSKDSFFPGGSWALGSLGARVQAPEGSNSSGAAS